MKQMRNMGGLSGILSMMPGMGKQMADDGKRRTASGIAVHLGQDHSVHADLFIKVLRHIDSVLTGHGGKSITVIMMCGLQGAGKTTTTAKIAGKLKLKGKKPLLVACDVYRPAAISISSAIISSSICRRPAVSRITTL